MERDKVEALFAEGVKEYDIGLPLPDNRVKAMGWRAAKVSRQYLKEQLDEAIDCFVRMKRGEINL